MTTRLEQAFATRAEAGHAALVTYIMAGDPTLPVSAEIALALQEAGADILEIGVPFSDPIADGPTIQDAGLRALKEGVTLSKVIDMVAGVREQGLKIPVVLMGYLNPIMRMGYAEFAERAVAAGVDGVIIPDFPADEAQALLSELDRVGMAPVQLVAPTTTDARIEYVSSKSRGFLYYVSLTGVTGIRDSLPADISERIRRVQSLSPVPVAVGFGVSNPEMARALGQVAPGVVVGSAIVKLVEKHGVDAPQHVSSFVRQLKGALDEVSLESV